MERQQDYQSLYSIFSFDIEEIIHFYTTIQLYIELDRRIDELRYSYTLGESMELIHSVTTVCLNEMKNMANQSKNEESKEQWTNPLKEKIYV